MKIKRAAVLGTAALVVAGSVGVGEAMAAGKAKQPTHPSATFTMYANVDAEGDLGSNFDAKSVTVTGTNQYKVTFTHKIGTCASVVQPGKAGGPDATPWVAGVVTNAGNYKKTKSLLVSFLDVESLHGAQAPFMLTVTCRYTK